jgi:hypothetical protein
MEVLLQGHGIHFGINYFIFLLNTMLYHFKNHWSYIHTYNPSLYTNDANYKLLLYVLL